MPQMKATSVTLEELEAWSKERWLEYWMEPKYDGGRLLYHAGEFSSYSGKPYYNLERIRKALKGCEYTLDGEVKAGTWADTMSIIRSKKPKDSASLVFYVFDAMMPVRWDTRDNPNIYTERRRWLTSWIRRYAGPNVQLAPVYRVTCFADFHKLYKRCLKEGCDGIILKLGTGRYEWKRSKLWLKLKPAIDFEAVVTGFTEGEGKYLGTLGALQLRYKDVCFTASGMTDAQRAHIWTHQATYMGHLAQVVCRGWHPSGQPIEPRFKRWRVD